MTVLKICLPKRKYSHFVLTGNRVLTLKISCWRTGTKFELFYENKFAAWPKIQSRHTYFPAKLINTPTNERQCPRFDSATQAKQRRARTHLRPSAATTHDATAQSRDGNRHDQLDHWRQQRDTCHNNLFTSKCYVRAPISKLDRLEYACIIRANYFYDVNGHYRKKLDFLAI